MKTSSPLIIMLLVGFFASCTDKSSENRVAVSDTGISVDSAKAMIMANNVKLGSLLQAGDTTGWSEMYTADGCAYPAGMPKICGRADIAAFTGFAYRTMGARGIRVNTEEVLKGDGFFVEIGTYEMLDGSGKTIDKGKTLVVWKEENGTLKLHRDFFNTDLPVPVSGN